MTAKIIFDFMMFVSFLKPLHSSKTHLRRYFFSRGDCGITGVQKTGIVAPLSLRERLDSGH
jgi:hypothetical protein